MTTQTQKTASKRMRAMALAVLLGISGAADALCLQADGSLDDISMNADYIARDMLPACGAQSGSLIQASDPQVAQPQLFTKQAVKSTQEVKKAGRAE